MLRHAKRNGVHQPSVNRIAAPLKPSEVHSNASDSFFSHNSTPQPQVSDHDDRVVDSQDETLSLHSRQNTLYLSSQEPMSPNSSFMSPAMHDASPTQRTFGADCTSPANDTNDSLTLLLILIKESGFLKDEAVNADQVEKTQGLVPTQLHKCLQCQDK